PALRIYVEIADVPGRVADLDYRVGRAVDRLRRHQREPVAARRKAVPAEQMVLSAVGQRIAGTGRHARPGPVLAENPDALCIHAFRPDMLAAGIDVDPDKAGAIGGVTAA